MSDQTPALASSSQPALFDDLSRIGDLPDQEYRMLALDSIAWLKGGMAQVRIVVGTFLAQHAARYGEQSEDYKALFSRYRELTYAPDRTLARWRANAQATLSKPARVAGSISAKPADEIPKISAGEGAGSAAAVAPPAEPPSGPTPTLPPSVADEADDGVEREDGPPSRSAVKGSVPAEVPADPSGEAGMSWDAGNRNGQRPRTERSGNSRDVAATASDVTARRDGHPGRVAHGAAGEPQTAARGVHETRDLTGRHVEHYRSCGCLADSATCCDRRCCPPPNDRDESHETRGLTDPTEDAATGLVIRPPSALDLDNWSRAAANPDDGPWLALRCVVLRLIHAVRTATGPPSSVADLNILLLRIGRTPEKFWFNADAYAFSKAFWTLDRENARRRSFGGNGSLKRDQVQPSFKGGEK